MMINQQKKKTNRRQINIQNDWEIAYWSKRFGCTPDELVKVVKSAGTSPIRVARELEKILT